MSKTISDYKKEIAKIKQTLVVSKNMITELENELAHVKTILDNVPALVFMNEAGIKGNEYYLKNVYANKTAYDFTGYKRKDCDDMGDRFAEIVIHPDDYPASRQSFEYFCMEENRDKMFGGPYRCRLKNGVYIWGIGYVKAINPADGSVPKYFINCLIPLTEAMQLDPQLQTLIEETRKKGKEFITKKISKREMQVLMLITQGCSVKTISEKLFVSENTIHTHVSNIMKKLDLHSMSALACFAMQNGIV